MKAPLNYSKHNLTVLKSGHSRRVVPEVVSAVQGVSMSVKIKTRPRALPQLAPYRPVALGVSPRAQVLAQTPGVELVLTEPAGSACAAFALVLDRNVFSESGDSHVVPLWSRLRLHPQ
jgi:hypothetical protein